MSAQGEHFCLTLGNPICTSNSNYLLDCSLSRHSLLTWNKNLLFILTLSDGNISKILKTITKTKQNKIPIAVELILEGNLSFQGSPGRCTMLLRVLQPAPRETSAGSPWAETLTINGQLDTHLLPFNHYFKIGTNKPFLLASVSQNQSFSPGVSQFLPHVYITCTISY